MKNKFVGWTLLILMATVILAFFYEMSETFLGLIGVLWITFTIWGGVRLITIKEVKASRINVLKTNVNDVIKLINELEKTDKKPKVKKPVNKK